MTPERHLIVFAKAPRFGQAKRRLARDIGQVGAIGFYDRTVRDLLRRVTAVPGWRTWLAVSPDSFVAEAPRVWPEAGRAHGVVPQGVGDIGVRMDRALRHPPPGPAVLVGADIPGLRARHIAAAFEELGKHDAVFGPATDGGFWLVGLRRRPTVPWIFRDVRWSGPDALSDTLANLRRLRLEWTLVEPLSDVDNGEDYRALRPPA